MVPAANFRHMAAEIGRRDFDGGALETPVKRQAEGTNRLTDSTVGTGLRQNF